MSYRIMTPGMKGYVNLYCRAYATSPSKVAEIVTEGAAEVVESDREMPSSKISLVDGKQFQARYEVG